MASIAGLYSFGAGRGRGGEDHSGDHRGDLGDRGGGGFRSGLFKKGRLGCSNNTNSQERSQVVKTCVELGNDEFTFSFMYSTLNTHSHITHIPHSLKCYHILRFLEKRLAGLVFWAGSTAGRRTSLASPALQSFSMERICWPLEIENSKKTILR